jgi:hypothetical protein
MSGADEVRRKLVVPCGLQRQRDHQRLERWRPESVELEAALDAQALRAPVEPDGRDRVTEGIEPIRPRARLGFDDEPPR